MLELKPIPVISTAVVSSTYWVQRLIGSVDYPTENFVIFNNNGRDQITEDLNNLAKIPHRFIKKISVVHLPANIGLTGTWNLTIKCYINAPYWLFCNDDIAFTPGFLEEMIRQTSDPEVGIVHGGPGDYGDGAWDIITIKDWVIQKYGLFDENCYPAYCEDIDYLYRIQNNVKRVKSIGRMFFHGLSTDYNAPNGGQQTKKSDNTLEHKLNMVLLYNNEYLDEKWGIERKISGPTSYTFGNPSLDVTITKYDINFNRLKYLGF